MCPDRWPVALHGSSLGRQVSEACQQHPTYVSKAAPCGLGCPTNGRIRECLTHIRERDYEGACRIWVEENPLPSTLGRICYAPCEEACNRARFDESVSIRDIERFLGDYAADQSFGPASCVKRKQARVACVGSGPAGLSCAYHLVRRGYEVTVFEALPVAGGMLRVGVPAFHLPPKVLQREIDRILEMGVEVKLNARIQDINALFQDGYRAVFIAIGAPQGKKPAIPGVDLPGVLAGTDFLRQVSLGEEVKIGRNILVLGGGNVAIDVARTSLRFGSQVQMACLESRQTMPALISEVQAAEAEGLVLYPARTVTEIIHTGDQVVGVRCLTVDAFNFNQEGNPVLVTRPGSERTLPCDMVICAIGQTTDLDSLAWNGSLQSANGTRAVDPMTLATTVRGVLAGGDCIPDCGTATRALGYGKRAAVSIDAYLSGRTGAEAESGIADYDRLHLHYYRRSARHRIPAFSSAESRRDFSEIRSTGYDAETARSEATRCFSCGQCFGCDNCWIFCPDMAVRKSGLRASYSFEYVYCKGCGICAHECPCGYIELR